jgi:hypothetical protein
MQGYRGREQRGQGGKNHETIIDTIGKITFA